MRCILLAVLLVAGVGAEQSNVQSPPSGTARIRGSVVDAGTGTPVRRASLRLTMVPPGRGSWTAISDGSGAFEFPDLPAGRFALSASKGGYVTAGPGQSPGEASRRIATTGGGTVDLPPIRLPRGGVITGRILDEYGDTVPEITVQAFRAEYISGVRRLSSARSAQTNDIGQFRIYGLQPGTYYVAASARGADGRPITIAEPGTEAVAGSGGLAPTFFPGTVVVNDAQRIEVSAASEIPGVDFSLLPVRLARITGTIVDSRSRPVSGYVVMLNQARPEAWQLGQLKVAEADDSGRFTLADVPPGEYRLDVRSKASIEAIAQTGGSVGQSQADDAPEFASVPLNVSGGDMAGLTIRLTTGFEIRGRLAAGGSSLGPDELKAIRVSALEGIPGMSATLLAAGGSVHEDATFRVRGLIGRRFVRVSGLPQGWVLESVRAGGFDVTDAGIDIQQDVHDVQITITNQPATIAGIVTDSSGQPVAGAAVGIFPEDRDRRAAPLNRFVVSRRTGPDGRFEIKGLPPAAYYAFAVPRLTDGEWAQPDQLEGRTAHATRVTIDAGQSINVALRLLDR